MKLYFLRHGKADWPDWAGSDDERPLTKKGRKEVRKVGRLLEKLEITPAICASPLPRARETAEIVAEVLGAQVRVDRKLSPGFDARHLVELLKDFSSEDLMLVGHEPDFTRAISRLTGASTKLSKAAVALVELDAAIMRGRLLWLLPAKVAL